MTDLLTQEETILMYKKTLSAQKEAEPVEPQPAQCFC